MELEQKTSNSSLHRYRAGSILIWIGVLTWLPFIVLRIAGEKPSLFWFLPFHLLGVVGGGRLRAVARKELSNGVPERKTLRMIGHVLVYAGILVWAPYFYMKYALQQPVDVNIFLPFHLTGIFSGIGVLGLNYWITKKK